MGFADAARLNGTKGKILAALRQVRDEIMAQSSRFHELNLRR